MGTVLIVIGTFILVLVCVALTLVVLMQRANTQGGLGTAFGGGVAETTFGAETGNVLTRLTIFAAIAFFLLSLTLYLGHMYVANTVEEDDVFLPDMPAMSTDAAAAEEPASADLPAEDVPAATSPQPSTSE